MQALYPVGALAAITLLGASGCKPSPPSNEGTGPPQERFEAPLGLPPKGRASENGELSCHVSEDGMWCDIVLRSKHTTNAAYPVFHASLDIQFEPAGLKVLYPDDLMYTGSAIRQIEADQPFLYSIEVAQCFDIGRSEDGLYRCRWVYNDKVLNELLAGKVPLSTMGRLLTNEFFMYVKDGNGRAYRTLEDVPGDFVR